MFYSPFVYLFWFRFRPHLQYMEHFIVLKFWGFYRVGAFPIFIQVSLFKQSLHCLVEDKTDKSLS
jgi:uncharacterized membrane protein